MLIWYPYKFDLPLARLPKATYAVVGLCMILFAAQLINTHYFEKGIENFCAAYPDEKFFTLLTSFDDARSEQEECYDVIHFLHTSKVPDLRIREGARHTVQEHVTTETADSVYLIVEEAYRASQAVVPINIRVLLSYHAASFNPFTAITSDFIHGGWWHIIGNLLFFLAFSAIVELVLESHLRYTVILILSSLCISFIWSLTEIGNPYVRSLGLSGVVSVFMGMAVYLVPKGRIRCGYLLGFYVGRVSIPVWWLFVWFFGWNIYYLWQFEQTGVNTTAHVVGMIFGYLFAKAFYQDERARLEPEIRKTYSKLALARIEKVGLIETIRKKS